MKIAPISVGLVDHMGSDLSVVNAARVSFDKESDWDEFAIKDVEKSRLKEADKKLISYLARHGHWSPFAHTSVQLRIKAPIFVARQLVKHQVGLVWNEVSRRYVDSEPEFYLPAVWRGRPINAKQGSDGEIDIRTVDIRAIRICLEDYQTLLELGVAPEQARMVLPQNTMTEWWWTGSVMAFARVCHQRLDSHAQAETREVAEGINNIVKELFPISWNALMNKE